METRNYELMFIVSPELDEEALDSLLQRVQQYLENAETQVFSRKAWGLRRLAYTIKGQREGRYFLVLFAARPDVISELDRNLRVNEGILRHLITRAEGVEVPEGSEELTEEEPEAAAAPTAEASEA
ncbi:MAG: 30S ribosomal protein S6 [Anaerolineae bacterium]